jgi:hypothetical protein
MVRMCAIVPVTRGGMRRPEVNFVANENHRHVDAERAEIREPIGGDSGEGAVIIDCIDDTEDMGLAWPKIRQPSQADSERSSSGSNESRRF